MTNSVTGFPDRSAVLPSGRAMPLLGFGTWQITGDSAVTSTAAALESGYRHIDTATLYGNEREVGRALRESGIPRDEVFVTTKLPPDRASDAPAVLQESLEKLGVDHVDLWLVHWPPADELLLPAWRDLVAAQKDGLARDIGVSNYPLDLIDRLADDTGVLPAVNQIRWSPLIFDAAVLDGHQERGVVLEGYSALRGGTLDHPVIVEIAERLGRSPAQVILRWHLQHDVVAIPKSEKPERIRSNADLAGFELSTEDMASLDSLSS
jgi:diketogulonate reductase-like aldo/keto reductase